MTGRERDSLDVPHLVFSTSTAGTAHADVTSRRETTGIGGGWGVGERESSGVSRACSYSPAHEPGAPKNPHEMNHNGRHKRKISP
ncbi:uncharacterized [Tachysurus ichikawai]